jgi:putative ATPase
MSDDFRSQESLFYSDEIESSGQEKIKSDAPLAARMRPQTMEEFIGQDAILGEGSLLRKAIQEDRLSSVIFWGPPGCGKSTLASIIARTSRSSFENLSAVTSGVADVRKVIDRARERRKKLGGKTILFVDEIHRWNKAQQDALLPHVEEGVIVLIGATTENPFFEVNSPLISRSRIFRFQSLNKENIKDIVYRALQDKERGLGSLNAKIEADALDHLLEISNGDARNALNALELAALSSQPDSEAVRHITLPMIEDAAQQRTLKYDKQSDEHYDTISAFIKSVRGSDPDAALYWLAKMLLAGEDPRFIARRLCILASEDIGNADPMGIVVANSAAQVVMFIGMPEAQLTLSQATCYLASAPKSNASCIGINKASKEIRENGPAQVPMHLRNAPHPGLMQFGIGQGYLYPHDFPGHWIEQDYLPEEAKNAHFYEPSEEGAEKQIKVRLEGWKARKRK